MPQNTPLRLLHIAAEAAPFCYTGGLGEVVSALPAALSAQGEDARVIMPYYATAARAFGHTVRFIGSCTVPLAWRQQYCGLLTAEHNGVTYYFIDNQYYFFRDGLYGYPDDAERFAFFSRAVLHALPLMDFAPDILHVHDWHAAMVPVYLQAFYRGRPLYDPARTLLTIHNSEYQGVFDHSIIGDVLGLDERMAPWVDYNGRVNLLKGGMACCDRMTTVSPCYAREIEDDFYAHGLAAMVRREAGKLSGIVNGIDTRLYDPAADPALAAPYSAANFADKQKNRRALQALAGLRQTDELPILAMVTRLAGHKGLDLVTNGLELLLNRPLQLVVLGQGEGRYEEAFRCMAGRAGGKMAAMITYNPDLARKIYAGADLFLMPSRTEPCGLAQMIACRYGTLPIVRKTGGLSDTIADHTAGGTGFVFQPYTTDALLHAVDRAVELYAGHPAAFTALARRAMALDFSWQASAGQYAALYRRMLAA